MFAPLPFVSMIAGAVSLAVITRSPAMDGLVWVMLAGLLYASRSLPAWPGLAVLTSLVYVAVIVGQRGVLPISGGPYYLVSLLITLVTLLPFAVDRLVTPHAGVWTRALLFPLMCAGVELLAERFTPAATWGSLGYTQSANLPLMQLVSVTGIFGVTFLVAWIASTIVSVATTPAPWIAMRGPVVACAVVAAAVLIAGSLRLASPTGGPIVRVATLTRPIDIFVPGEITQVTEGRVPADAQHLRDKVRRMQDWFLDHSRRAAEAGATVVAWPEGNLLVFAEDEPAFFERARDVARGSRVSLLMGMGTITVGAPKPFENKAVLVEPTGRVALTHRKSKAVMGWEASIMQRGDGRIEVADSPAGRLAAAICYEGDFPDLIRQAGAAGADLLVVPANDWAEIKERHVQMAVARAVENGAPLIRPSSGGISVIVDATGRLLARSDFSTTVDHAMTAEVPTGHRRTLYLVIGDLFAWCCVLAAAVVGVLRP